MDRNIVTIGIVDDEQLICSYLENVITHMGPSYQLVGNCNSGTEALAVWADNPPNVIITDIMMSDMDGLEMMQQIRQLGWKTELIVLSGHDDFSFAQKAICYDVFRYLLKPIHMPELIKAISDAAANYQEKYAKQRRLTYEQMCNGVNCSMCALIIRCGRCAHAYGGDHSLLEALFVLIRTKLNENENIWIEGHHLLVLFQNSGSSADENRIAAIVDLSVGMLASQDPSTKLYCYVGIGCRGEKIDKLLSSRHEAYMAAERAYFQGKNGHYRYSENNEKERDNNANLAQYREAATQLAYGMISNDTKGIVKTIQKHFLEGCLVEQLADRESFYSEAGMLYLLLGLMLHEKGFDEILRPVEEFLALLRKKHSFETAVSFFEQDILAACEELSGMDTDGNTVIVKIKQYLLKNYERDITLKELSDTFFLCTSYLSTYFKKETGQTISDYLIMLRIQEAKKLLQRPELSVEEIAQRIGYNNGRYFSTLFKKMTGFSPVQYRLRRMNEHLGDAED